MNLLLSNATNTIHRGFRGANRKEHSRVNEQEWSPRAILPRKSRRWKAIGGLDAFWQKRVHVNILGLRSRVSRKHRLPDKNVRQAPRHTDTVGYLAYILCTLRETWRASRVICRRNPPDPFPDETPLREGEGGGREIDGFDNGAFRNWMRNRLQGELVVWWFVTCSLCEISLPLHGTNMIHEFGDQFFFFTTEKTIYGKIKAEKC